MNANKRVIAHNQEREQSLLAVIKALSEKLQPDLTVRGLSIVPTPLPEFTPPSSVKDHEEREEMPLLQLSRHWTLLGTAGGRESEKTLRLDKEIGTARTAFDFGPWRVTEETLSEMVKRNPEVRVINLAGSQGLNSRLLASLAQKMKYHASKLRHICLNGWSSKQHEVDAAVAMLAASCEASLISLELANTELSDHGLVMLARRCKNLQVLDVSACRFVTDAGISAVLCATTNPGQGNSAQTRNPFSNQLKTLHARDCPSLRGRWFLTESHDGKVAIVVTWLETVSLSGCKLIGDESIIELSFSAAGSLKTLEVNHCSHLSDVALKSLGKHCTHLSSLMCDGCPHISDDGIIALCTGVVKQLQAIGLSDTNISDLGLSALVEAFRHSLKEVKSTMTLDNTSIHSVQQRRAGLSRVERLSATMSNKDTAKLAALRKKQHRLRGDWAIALQVAGAEARETIPPLEVISVAGQTMFTAMNLSLLYSTSLHKLKELDVSGCEAVNDEFVAGVCTNCPALYLLKLGNCPHITDQALAALSCAVLPIRDLDISFHPHLPQEQDMLSNRGIMQVLMFCKTLIRFECKFRKHLSFDTDGHGFTNTTESLQPRNQEALTPRQDTSDYALEFLALDGCSNVSEHGLTWVLAKFPLLDSVTLAYCPQLRHQDLQRCIAKIDLALELAPHLRIAKSSTMLSYRVRQQALARVSLEEESVKLLQRRVRKYLQAPVTIQYILLTEGKYLDKYARLIQALWRRKKKEKFVAQVITKSNAAKTIQRMYRAFLWRKRIKLFLHDDSLRILRKQLAERLLHEHATAQVLQKWYRRFLWEQSPEGLHCLALMKEAKVELAWLKKQRVWKDHMRLVLKQLLENVNRRQVFHGAHTHLRSEVIAPAKTSSKQHPSCKSCTMRSAEFWCALCMGVLCHSCTWSAASHQVHARACREFPGMEETIRKLEPLPRLQQQQQSTGQELCDIASCCELPIRDMRMALGEITNVLKLRAKLLLELQRKHAEKEKENKKRRMRAEKKARMKLESAALLVQTAFRRQRAQRAAQIVLSRQTEIREKEHAHRITLAATKIQALFRGLEPYRHLRDVWKEIRKDPEQPMKDKKSKLQVKMKPYFAKQTRYTAIRNAAATVELLGQIRQGRESFRRDVIDSQLAIFLPERDTNQTKAVALAEEITALKEKYQSNAGPLLRVAQAKRHHNRLFQEALERRIYILESQTGVDETYRVARSDCLRRTYESAFKRIQSQVQNLTDIENFLHKRRDAIHSVLAEESEAREIALAALYEKSRTREVAVLCKSPQVTLQQLETLSNCELDWIAEKLGEKTYASIARGRSSTNQVQEHAHEQKQEQTSQNENQERLEEGDMNNALAENVSSNAQLGEPKVQRGETQGASPFERFDDHNIPRERERYWQEAERLTKYELKRLAKQLQFETYRQEATKKLLGLYKIHDSFVNEILTLSLQRVNDERQGRNMQVVKLVGIEEDIRGKLVKLHGRIKRTSTELFTSLRQFDRTLEAITKEVVRGRGQLDGTGTDEKGHLRKNRMLTFRDFTGFLPPTVRVKHKVSVKVLVREVRYEAWTALLPPRFFTDQLRLEADEVLQRRLHNALNARLANEAGAKFRRVNSDGVEVNEKGEVVGDNEEEEIPTEELEKKGAFVAELIDEARQRERAKNDSASGRLRFFSDIQERVRKWIYGDREAMERIENAMRKKREMKAQKRIYGVAFDMRFTVGSQETTEFDRKQQLRKIEGLDFWIRVAKNLGNDIPVHLWFRVSENPAEIVSDFRVSHSRKKNVLHLSLPASFKRISHASMKHGHDEGPSMELYYKLEEDLDQQERTTRFVMDIQAANTNEVSLQQSLRTDGYTLVEPDLGALGLRAGMHLWIKWSDHVQVGGSNDAVMKTKIKPGESLQLETKREELARRLDEKEDEKDRHELEEMIQEIDKKLQRIAEAIQYEKEFLLRKAVDFLALSKDDLKYLVKKFSEIDSDESGQISTAELFYYIGVPDTPFTNKVFHFFDQNSDGTLDFGELLHILSTFALFGGEEIARMCFQYLSPTDDGRTSIATVQPFLSLMHGVDPEELPVLRNALNFFKQLIDNQGMISIQDFVNMNKRYPAALYPVVTIRDKLRVAFFGIKWWEKRLHMYATVRARLNSTPIMGESRTGSTRSIDQKNNSMTSPLKLPPIKNNK